ncbi:MAG: tetratricopeptide repeat protein [Candidatus Zixiibacteriota bacterium]|nr:MAG: tetratricopeptide repeat protein [candidate division Zixibacteria bacterium]
MNLKAGAFKTVTPLALTVFMCLSILASSAFSGDPEKAKGHFNSALTLMKEGNDSLAVLEYRKAIEEDPTFIDAYINLGSYYFSKGKVDEAERYFKQATEAEGAVESADAWANLGRTYYKQKKYVESEQAYGKALSINGDYTEVYKDRGRLYMTQKNWPASVEDLSAYTEKVTDDHLGFYMLGKGYQKLKKYPLAIEAFNKSIGIKDDYFNSYNSLGQIYQAQENHTQAFKMFKKAVELKSDSYQAQYNLAISYETVYQDDETKIEQVIAYWSKFLQVAKASPRAKTLIPGAEEHVKQLKELQAHYEEENAREFE